ncbi:GNAT family N-acetyltransferase [Rhodanobacter sp. B05]|uniref:GNAT family N-acetyltransferase n=1 Tax=Rhodanobacter sp. B05 TaxID=1945859 RepID=UPI000986FA76|nr:GNAT family N-acetyltransferase [Rhodanobacter sp. B05]OOG53887.1 GNAT family N-acetyltransferase [Rhodanobacter sp. B05]
MTQAGLTFRPAVAADVAPAVPLIHSSGPAAFDYVFAVPGVGDAQAFLRHAFVDGAGEFGWRNHVVGVLDGAVVAAGAGFGGATKWSFTLAAARQILGHYGWRHAAGVIVRGLRVEAVIPPPTGAMYYLGHLGVSESLRGQGAGTALVAHLLAAQPVGAGPVVLDVAATNPAAQRLYERLGFAVVVERRSTLANAQGRVPDQRRMQRQTPA